ncbi:MULTISPECIES: carbohydrate kinase family protein [unclassified Rhizobium]|uniref:carbohydrate kinase family protein n=1 Tax=unclassified Rhizobium TaxID=2613769 RepID=UPI0006FC2ECA|nr:MULTISPECIES: carbohydrate kinase family protein [unclassified Rhizobium]KQV34265.1 carbohydrate kinase [Rhizobium sp. Root1212]KRD23643.1 carbohydrate kinase [Rhizobium sp. Root268]
MTPPIITVFGGAHIDRRGRIFGVTIPGASNPGAWFEEAGGGGFNAARNLARLGLDVRMVGPRGGDAVGETVAAAAVAAGVDDRPFIFLDRRTPSYTAIIENDGNLVIALADMELYNLFSPRRLRQRAMRETIAESDLILMDANLPSETLTALTEKGREEGKTVAAIAISPAKVVRLVPGFPSLDFLFMNEAEARALTGKGVEDAAQWPDLLREKGLMGGVITRGGRSVIAYDKSGTVAVVPPKLDALGDVTGAGDALASGFLFATLQGKSLAESLRTGVAAAGLTVASPLAVSENMTVVALQSAITLVPEAQILS